VRTRSETDDVVQVRSVKSQSMMSKLLLRTPADPRPILETAARLEHQWLVWLSNFVSGMVVRSRRVIHLLF
jgi:hypothetical protein